MYLKVPVTMQNLYFPLSSNLWVCDVSLYLHSFRLYYNVHWAVWFWAAVISHFFPGRCSQRESIYHSLDFVYTNLGKYHCETSSSAYLYNARICSWNQPVLCNESKFLGQGNNGNHWWCLYSRLAGIHQSRVRCAYQCATPPLNY